MDHESRDLPLPPALCGAIVGPKQPGSPCYVGCYFYGDTCSRTDCTDPTNRAAEGARRTARVMGTVK